MKPLYLAQMPWPDVETLLPHHPLVIIPTGSTENHGPHLPLATDSLIIAAIIERAITQLPDGFPCLITPLLPIGLSGEHRDFPGTLYLRTETYLHLITDYIQALASHGFTRFLIANGHGGNTPILTTALVHVRDSLGLTVRHTDWIQLLKDQIPPDHAGPTETSMILATHPHLVHAPLPTEPVPFNLGFIPHTTSVFPRIQTVSPQGYLGTPSDASAERGHEILDLAAVKLATLLQAIP